MRSVLSSITFGCGLLFPYIARERNALTWRTQRTNADISLVVLMTFFPFRERTAKWYKRWGEVHRRWKLGADSRRRCRSALSWAVRIENQLSGKTGPYQFPIPAVASSGKIPRKGRATVQGAFPTFLEIHQVSVLFLEYVPSSVSSVPRREGTKYSAPKLSNLLLCLSCLHIIGTSIKHWL